MASEEYEDLLRDLYDERDRDLKLIAKKAGMLEGIRAFLEGMPWEIVSKTTGEDIRTTVLNMIKKVDE